MFVGYQANGTLGRQILDGQQMVRIHGGNYLVRARIERIYGCSGHADRSGLLYWAEGFEQPPKRVFLTHGEEAAAQALGSSLQVARGWNVLIPDYQSVTDLK